MPQRPLSDSALLPGAAPPAVAPGALAGLTHVLTHRLGGLVSTVETYADLLIDTLDTPDQRAMALSVFEAAAHIERILADLRRYSQAVEPVVQTVRMGAFAQTLPPLFGTADAARLALEVEAPAERSISADPVLLRQALMVLVQNGLDATPPPAPVRLFCAGSDVGPDAGGHVCLTVWNEGAIEEAETLEKLFQPFFTTKAQNLGVGLPLARRIAEAHGGTLRLAATSAAEGTRFELRLPAAARPRDALALRSPPTP